MTWVVLLDVTAEHDDARKIQQKAYDMTLLNVREARLMAKLETAHKELTLAHSELAESRDELRRVHDRLQRELRDAERYVLAILPPPVTEPFKPLTGSFVPSTELEEIPSVITGATTSTLPFTCWTSAVMASMLRCCPFL